LSKLAGQEPTILRLIGSSCAFESAYILVGSMRLTDLEDDEFDRGRSGYLEKRFELLFDGHGEAWEVDDPSV
jgi:hypothetical protein